ncbi:MAG: A/G-specific adenine glycosylase [Actinomycetota bacterium]|nr:A/G-specific adenine glycosylase [Actinomycetota bacterium]
MPHRDLHEPILQWYAGHARDLPWRRGDATAWSILLSEVMLQQTPVARVLPMHAAWLARWPTPADLAAESPGEVIRAWGRLGYPRRALRLHAAAQVITERHRGVVPADLPNLRALPGVGEYTAAAVASFAFGRRHVVVDTNVRRVLARAVLGAPAATSPGAERAVAKTLVPEDPATAARWAVAVMELGALVCTARAPRCRQCPVRSACRWRASGSPSYGGPARRTQSYAGTDRQCRGRLLGVVRETAGPVSSSVLDAAWEKPAQRERALAGLVADGLVQRQDDGTYCLPR